MKGVVRSTGDGVFETDDKGCNNEGCGETGDEGCGEISDDGCGEAGDEGW